MIYTIVFYILLLICTTQVKNKDKAINSALFVAFLYMGLRYNYMPDYKNYLAYFELVASGYEYTDGDHMEYGWYLLNKFFSPITFFGFEFVISFLTVWALKLYLREFVSLEYLPFVVLGFFSSGAFTLALSAHRQLVAAVIFLLSYYYLLYNRLETLKDLKSWRVVVYFIIIYLCSQLHSSASFLYVIPFFHFIPNKKYVGLGFVGLVFLTMFVGKSFLPGFVEVFYMQYDRYVDILEHEIEMENMTIISFLSYTMQLIFLFIAFINSKTNTTTKFFIFVALFSVFCSVSIFSISQMYRLNVYIGFFAYMAISLIAENWDSEKIPSNIIKVFYGLWIFWNCTKVLSVNPDSVEAYKTIFSIL